MMILAIDLGQYTSVSCLYDTDSTKAIYRKIKMTPQAMHNLFVEIEPDRVVIEIGPAAGWVHDLATSLELEIEVANTNHEAWRWRNVKCKTDRRDALKLAELSAMKQLPTVHVPKPAVRQWRALIAYRQTLVKRRTQLKNSIRSILTRQGLKMPTGKSGWTKKSVRELEQMTWGEDGATWRMMLKTELQAFAEMEDKIRTIERELQKVAKADRRVALLKSAPCVGDRLSEAVVAIIDDPHRFASGKQVGAYIGLTPRVFQSGTMDRQGRITGQGNAMLRALLVQVAWLGVARHKVPWMIKMYERVRRGSDQRKKIAIVAVARRLLIQCWAMLRDESPWRATQEAALKLAA